MPTPIVSVFPPFFENRMGYDIPNSELIMPRNEKLNEILEARPQ